jgi:hypothetical protein
MNIVGGCCSFFSIYNPVYYYKASYYNASYYNAGQARLDMNQSLWKVKYNLKFQRGSWPQHAHLYLLFKHLSSSEKTDVKIAMQHPWPNEHKSTHYRTL